MPHLEMLCALGTPNLSMCTVVRKLPLITALGFPCEFFYFVSKLIIILLT